MISSVYTDFSSTPTLAQAPFEVGYLQYKFSDYSTIYRNVLLFRHYSKESGTRLLLYVGQLRSYGRRLTINIIGKMKIDDRGFYVKYNFPVGSERECTSIPHLVFG